MTSGGAKRAISVPVKAVFLWAAAQKAKSEGRDGDSERIGRVLSRRGDFPRSIAITDR